MKVLVCDDEHLARDRLKRLLTDLDGFDVAGEARNGRDCISQVALSSPDVILMDIRMPEMDGLAAAKMISEGEAPPAIVFCTAYDDHALEAFKVSAVDYLLKPVRRDDLEQALTKARSLNKLQLHALDDGDNANNADIENGARTNISAKTHRGIELIPIDEIRYFLADQKYVTVRSGKGEVLIDETLKGLETEFENSFIRIHRNALVSKRYIDGLEQVGAGHYQVRLKETDERLTVSRRHVSGLRKMLQHL